MSGDYEKLRQQVLQQPASGSLGLSVLLTRGMAEWLQVMQAKPAIPSMQMPEFETVPAIDILPSGIKGEMIRILASMVMTLGQEVAYVY